MAPEAEGLNDSVRCLLSVKCWMTSPKGGPGRDWGRL